MEAQSLNHWTTREFPCLSPLNFEPRTRPKHSTPCLAFSRPCPGASHCPGWREALQTGAQTRTPGRKGTDPSSWPCLHSVDAFQQSPTSPASPRPWPCDLAALPAGSCSPQFSLGPCCPLGSAASPLPPTQCHPPACGNVQTSSQPCGRHRRLRAEP